VMIITYIVVYLNSPIFFLFFCIIFKEIAHN
jgi:hypothetical protein